MPDSSGARQVTRRELLDIRERQWAPLLRGVSLVAEVEIREDHRTQVASALGVLYAREKAVGAGAEPFLTRWPACLVASMTGVAVTSYAQGTYWPALWEAAGYHGSTNDQRVWGRAFSAALSELGLPTFPDSSLPYVEPILMHAGSRPTAWRLLPAARGSPPSEPGPGRRRFPGLGDGAPPSASPVPLDKPAERFLLNGGDYAHDVVDRTLDLLDRLTEPDPDFDAVACRAT